MKIQTFIGKVSIEGLHQMDDHINDWLRRNNVTPIHIQQSFGADIHHDGRRQEPIIIISIWYEPSEEE
jgi:hypothetical protein